MYLNELINPFQLKEMIEQKYINVSHHPSGLLSILNYSASCQLEKKWNDATEICRGLIVDINGKIVARPFRKFYNYEELENKSVIPHCDYDIYEKMDGSLGILYWLGDKPYISTRGSFESEQAQHATQLLHTKYKDIWGKLNKQYTYLFEIIYPGDIHVVPYGETDDIFLLAILDTETGKDMSMDGYENIFNITKHYPAQNWEELRNVYNGENREGFVIRFNNGFRMKLKYESYFRLHYLKSGLSRRRIFEYLRDHETDDLNDAIRLFDEENMLIFNKIIKEFNDKYNEIEETTRRELTKCSCHPMTWTNTKGSTELHKEAALYIRDTCTYPGVACAMAKNKNYDTLIWRLVENIV